MAGHVQMATRRFLFLASRRKVTLAPIYIALLGLLSLGLLGLLVAVWPPAAAPPQSAGQRAEGKPADDSRSSEGSYLPPPAAPKPRRSGTWM